MGVPEPTVSGRALTSGGHRKLSGVMEFQTMAAVVAVCLSAFVHAHG